MPFDKDLRDKIDEYVKNHLPDNDDVLGYFDYIRDAVLLERIKTEYVNARYLYKVFEGMGAKEELQLAQVRLQMIMYTSIYEAIVHHLLFVEFKDDPEVLKLKKIQMLKELDIPTQQYKKIEKELKHDGKDLLICHRAEKRNDITKVRFDKKCEVLEKLGLVSESMKDDLIEFYSVRNAVHIHAELRKSISYELEMSKKAFNALKEFNRQISEGIISKKLLDNEVEKISPVNKIDREISYFNEDGIIYGKWLNTLFRIDNNILDRISEELLINGEWILLGEKEKSDVGLGKWLKENIKNIHERYSILYSSLMVQRSNINVELIDGKYAMKKIN